MGVPKEKLQTLSAEAQAEEETSEREVFLRDGKKLVVSEQGGDQVVEIRSESGMLEVRIQLTEQGPVLQMESVRLSMKATEKLEIESKQVAIKGEQIAIESEENTDVTAKGEVRVVGKMIYLN